jgi:hypothetical protein
MINIIAKLQGGLGNQLFQYATARTLAHQSHRTLLLDYGWFNKTYENVTPRELLLTHLNTLGTFTSFEPPIKRPKHFRKILQKIWPITPYIFLERSPYQFNPKLNEAPTFKSQDLYLMGYWQSYRYFEAIKPFLQEEIKPKSPLSEHYQEYLNKIKSSDSAMVHIRRGDYVNLEGAAKVHGFVGLDYYQSGMAILLGRNPDTQFFIFSDDLTWAKANLPYQDKLILIESSDSKDAVVQELELMTHCQSHLIANSSLSWWAAWLSKNDSVICPKKWTNDLAMSWDDLLPAHWQRI